MRRWNGWGDDTVTAHTPRKALALLAETLGPPSPPRDAAFADVVAKVPPSRLPERLGASTLPEVRLRHARGQSLPDWIATRSGRIGTFPDAVATPSSVEELRTVLAFAAEAGAVVIPWGGGTSVAGHVNPEPWGPPALTVDMTRLCRLLRLDETSQLATFEAGVAGPDVEARLRAHGFTLGHFPQSFELSTLGGWIATRSSGQQSLGYGRIERLFAGGAVETPKGTLALPCFPASAAGPDLKELVLGSEGRIGIVTEATVRVSRLPEREDFHGVFFASWEAGLAALRELLQTRLPLSMLRLSGPEETRTSLLLAGHERLIGALERLLSWRGAGTGKCMLLVGLTGAERLVVASRKELLAISKRHGGIHVGRAFGTAFKKSRFRAPYLRNDLWEKGWAVDTLETAVPWSRVPATLAAVERAISGALEPAGEKVHVFTHLSHAYLDGSSLYTTYLFRLAPDPDQTLDRWRSLKTAASRAIVAHGGTISHQHGVGVDHAPYLEAEKGALGLSTIGAVLHHLDPEGRMNPGKLLRKEEPR